MRIAIPLTSDQWLNESLGIRSNSFFEKQGALTLFQKIQNVALTVFREICYAAKAGYRNISSLFLAWGYGELKPQADRSGLVVAFHGLNGQPSVWNGHLAKFEKYREEGAKIDLFAPPLPKRGHHSFDDPEMKPIYDQVRAWVAANPGKPLTILGQSNGSRFAAHLEQLLRDEFPNTSVHVSLTGAILYGTSLIDRIKSVVPPSLKTLSSGSAASQKLLESVRQPLQEGVAKRKYTMYAPTIDSHVWERGSSLPILSTNNEIEEEHYLVSGYGHNSIVDSVVDEQVAKAWYWMGEKNELNLEDHRSTVEKVNDLALTAINYAGSLPKKAFRRLVSKEFPVAKSVNGRICYSDLPWQGKESVGLNLFIHGLWGHPTDWNRHMERAEETCANFHTFAPFVYGRGNIPLEQAAAPILEALRDYVREHPGKPINIYGTSNGARIATYIENNLTPEELGNSKLRIVSIAGVLNGTEVVDRLVDYRLIRLAPLHTDLKREFRFQSSVARNLMGDWAKKQKSWKEAGSDVRHYYCATTGDELVRPIKSSLPQDADANCSYRVFHGQSHMSIVDASVEDVFGWLTA